MFDRTNAIEPGVSATERPVQRSRFLRPRPLEPSSIADDPPSIRQRFYILQRGETRLYYADYQQKQLAITADKARIRTTLDDRATVGAMLDLARARGWESIKLKGSESFKREAWVQAQLSGIAVTGYKPSETDKQEIERRLAESANPAPRRTAGAGQDEPRLVEAGAWQERGGGLAERVIVAQSSAGFHAARQHSANGADPAAPRWTKAYPTAEQAKAAARDGAREAAGLGVRDNVFARAETAGRALNETAQGQAQASKQSAGMAA
jgi:hypothetical protein